VARQDTIRTTASLNGTPLGEFLTFSGGELTSAKGKSLTYTGTLIRVAPGNADLQGDGLDDLEMEMSVSEVA
jgi:hypothetical protein